MVTALRIICLILPLSLWGFDYFPWLGNDFELDLTPYYISRYFPNVNTDAPSFHPHEYGNILGFESSFTVCREWSIGFFASWAQTTQMQFGLDGVTFMAAQQWSNDRLGDGITLTSFFTATGNSSRATRDLLLYHSARWELELHSALGKEWVDGPVWCYRAWMDLVFGWGTTGAPYLKGLLFYEHNQQDLFSWGLFAKSWIGFGTRTLKGPFYGYGPYRHRNLDLGLRYTYNTCYWGSMGVDLSVGVWTSNYPRTPLEGRLFWNFTMGP